MSNANDENLRTLNSILVGYSKYDLYGKCVYIKHPLQTEVNEIYLNYKESRSHYENQGIMSEKEQVDLICQMGWWTQEKESEIYYLKKSLERLRNTRAKLIYQTDKDRINEQILGICKKLSIVERKKSEYIQVTSEELASKDSSYQFISKFAFNDSKLSETFADIDNYTESLLLLAYHQYLSNFSLLNIKKVALSPTFQNMLCTSPSGSCIEVFGVPSIKLTKNQIELLTWGNYYQKLITNSTKEVPDELYNEPDKFIEWYESVNKVQINKNKAKKSSSKKTKYGSESKFLFGDREDVKMISEGEISGDKILKEAELKGGKLDLYDLMEK